MDPAVPVEKPSAGAFGVYDLSAHGPRLFGGPAGGPQRVCVLCMLDRERWCRRQRDAELGFVAGLLCDARCSLEPTMTERDVLAGELEAANKCVSHLQLQVSQVASPPVPLIRDSLPPRPAHLLCVSSLCRPAPSGELQVNGRRGSRSAEAAGVCGGSAGPS